MQILIFFFFKGASPASSGFGDLIGERAGDNIGDQIGDRATDKG